MSDSLGNEKSDLKSERRIRVKFLEAEKKILSSAKEEGSRRGYHLVEPEPNQSKTLQARGYDMIAFSVDIRMLDIVARLPFKN